MCVCKKCMAAHRFGPAELDNIFNSFEDDDERECIIKNCLQYHCEKAGLVCLVQKEDELNLEKCHMAARRVWGLLRFESAWSGNGFETLLHEAASIPGHCLCV